MYCVESRYHKNPLKWSNKVDLLRYLTTLIKCYIDCLVIIRHHLHYVGLKRSLVILYVIVNVICSKYIL